MDILTYMISRKYTDESIKGIHGALAGKNCVINSITKENDVNIVEFEWTATDGTRTTSHMYVKDGVQRVRLNTDGNHIYDKDGTILTFTQVKDLIMNERKFVTLTMDDNVSFLPSAYDGEAIWFDAGFIEVGIANQLRVIINKQNQVKIDQIELADISDVNTLDAKITNVKSDIELVENEIADLELAIEEKVDKDSIIYSTNETIVGAWINNKPIYRRVYELADTSIFQKGVAFKVSDLPTDFEMMVKGFATLKTYQNSYTNSDILVYSTVDSIMAKQNFTGYPEKMWVVVEYTKSTD